MIVTNFGLPKREGHLLLSHSAFRIYLRFHIITITTIPFRHFTSLELFEHSFTQHNHQPQNHNHFAPKHLDTLKNFEPKWCLTTMTLWGLRSSNSSNTGIFNRYNLTLLKVMTQDTAWLYHMYNNKHITNTCTNRSSFITTKLMIHNKNIKLCFVHRGNLWSFCQCTGMIKIWKSIVKSVKVG